MSVSLHRTGIAIIGEFEYGPAGFTDDAVRIDYDFITAIDQYAEIESLVGGRGHFAIPIVRKYSRSICSSIVFSR